MITLITFEHETSQPEIRECNMAHAVNLGENGGFYKVQIVGEFGEIIVEYK